MKKLIILRGPSGCGKSSYAKELAQEAFIASADDFFMKNGEYEFDPTLLPQAHQKCLAMTIEAMRREEPLIVVDNTNIHIWEWDLYHRLGMLAKYDVTVVEFRVTTVEEIKRCIQRNQHKVPPTVIMNQVLQFEPYELSIALTMG